MPALADWVQEAPTPPRGHRISELNAAASGHDAEPATRRRGTEEPIARHNGAPPPLLKLDAPSLTPPMGATISPPRRAWRATLILTGTLLGVGAILATYNLILLQSERSRSHVAHAPEALVESAGAEAETATPKAPPPAAFHVDLSTAQNRDRALETISNVVLQAAPRCGLAATRESLDLVVRRGPGGRLESVAVTDLTSATRRCLTDALEAVAVAPSARAAEPWSVTVTLRR